MIDGITFIFQQLNAAAQAREEAMIPPAPRPAGRPRKVDAEPLAPGVQQYILSDAEHTKVVVTPTQRMKAQKIYDACIQHGKSIQDSVHYVGASLKLSYRDAFFACEV